MKVELGVKTTVDGKFIQLQLLTLNCVTWPNNKTEIPSVAWLVCPLYAGFCTINVHQRWLCGRGYNKHSKLILFVVNLEKAIVYTTDR